jgi:hypothetical protein
MKITDIEDKLHVSSVSKRAGVFTVRDGFFYRHGRNSGDLVQKVRDAFPTAKILDQGEVWKAFRGGASVANQSHWFVKFSIE